MSAGDPMDAKAHWENVYSSREATSVSWYQATPARSLDLIAQTRAALDARVFDVGGGDSVLVDHLVERGYSNLLVLDISSSALERAKRRLGAAADRVDWMAADVLTADLQAESMDVWHDRAVFHFLTQPEQRSAYLAQVRRAVRPGGHVIVATFADDGPTRCSGLPVARYSAMQLHAAFGDDFRLARSEREVHRTPSGGEQRFCYCLCRHTPGNLLQMPEGALTTAG